MASVHSGGWVAQSALVVLSLLLLLECRAQNQTSTNAAITAAKNESEPEVQKPTEEQKPPPDEQKEDEAAIEEAARGDAPPGEAPPKEGQEGGKAPEAAEEDTSSAEPAMPRGFCRMQVVIVLNGTHLSSFK
ncbi:unnamed protein product [Gongylonema pulchrum]|uniref:Uncharacterized protein n=1 Tax=Gongylonema pulchrum TaxID=637853 RepID=A0A183F1M3_9BILA|nr:unnamed protein product [Gongylonema pulchrum]